jgi:hypothetical protein
MLVSRRARLDRFPWPVHLDEFRLAGRVVRRNRPDVWIYEHHENGGAVCADAMGRTYRFTATPQAKGPGQFRECPVRPALWRARLPDVVEPVWYEHPDPGWADGLDEAGPDGEVGLDVPGQEGASGATAADHVAQPGPAPAAYAAHASDEMDGLPGDWRQVDDWSQIDDDEDDGTYGVDGPPDDDWRHAGERVIRRGHLSLVAG